MGHQIAWKIPKIWLINVSSEGYLCILAIAWTGFQEGDNDRDRLQQICFNFHWSSVFPSERILSLGECTIGSGLRGTAFREGRFGFLVAFPPRETTTCQNIVILSEFTVIYRTQSIAVIRDRQPLPVTPYRIFTDHWLCSESPDYEHRIGASSRT